MQISRKTLKFYAILTLIWLILIRFIFYPSYNLYKKNKEQLNRNIKNYETMLIIHKEKLARNVNKESIENLLFNGDPTFIQAIMFGLIKDLSQQQGLQLMSYEVMEPVIKENLMEVPLLVQLEGNPSQVLNFLYKIRGYPKLIEVKSFEARETERNYQFTLVLVSYGLYK